MNPNHSFDVQLVLEVICVGDVKLEDGEGVAEEVLVGSLHPNHPGVSHVCVCVCEVVEEGGIVDVVVIEGAGTAAGVFTVVV